MADIYRIEQGFTDKGRRKVPATKSADFNFVPVVQCPHCKKSQRAAISGWGGRVSTRWKVSKHCGSEFTVQIVVDGIKLEG